MSADQPSAVVVGTTSWGCTLAIQLDRAGTAVTILCRTQEESRQLASEREQRRLLPGIALPDSVRFATDFNGLGAVDLLIVAVPSQRMRDALSSVLAVAPRPLPPLLSASKGLEVDSDLRMSQVIHEALADAGLKAPVAALSGPNIAREVALGQATTAVIASDDAALPARMRPWLMTPAFRVYTNTDIIGVELGGALKNVIAIGVGIGDGLEVGANGRAAFLTRGLAEMARLGVALGARPLTFAGLTGLGDLIATAGSPRSRNRYVGEQLGRGSSLADILAGMVHVAEGVETTRAARHLAQQAGVDMPIVDAMYRVLFEGLNPTDAIHELMTREAGDELAGLPEIFPAS
jgi:glycerol-3-phosphate dehydrogenase (NAD(P)+)